MPSYPAPADARSLALAHATPHARADRRAAGGRGPRQRASLTPTPLLDRLEPRVVLSAQVVDAVLVVRGGGGADVMLFSAGNAPGQVVVRGVPGVADGTSFSGVDRVVVSAKGGDDNITVLGSPQDTAANPLRFVLKGQGGDDTLRAGPGDDVIRGLNGRDTVLGGDGADRIYGGKGADLLDGQAGDDSIEGNDADDTLLGGPGDDSLRGGAGGDFLRAGSGDDLLRGGFGEDDLYGAAGSDLVFGDRDRDVFRGLLQEFADFNREDANGFDALYTNPDRGTLSDRFWEDLDDIVGEGDITRDQATATTALQLLRARSADEGDNFDDHFADLSSHTRADVRDCTFDLVDEYLDDMYDNPDDINEFSMEAVRRVLAPCFPYHVEDEFDDYMNSLIELDNQLQDFGHALDRMDNTQDIDPWFREFEAFFDW